MADVWQYTSNPIGEHTYVVSAAEGGECVIVDPGCMASHEVAQLCDHIDRSGLKPVGIWLTHGHFDHVWGVAALKRRYGIEVWASDLDRDWQEENINTCMGWGLPAPERFEVEHHVYGGETVTSGKVSAKVIATPGHTRGGVSYYFEEMGFCLTGDTIFCGSVGRTDLMGGDMAALHNSVQTLLRLPEQTRLLPGHGDETTVGHERLYNPYGADMT